MDGEAFLRDRAQRREAEPAKADSPPGHARHERAKPAAPAYRQIGGRHAPPLGHLNLRQLVAFSVISPQVLVRFVVKEGFRFGVKRQTPASAVRDVAQMA